MKNSITTSKFPLPKDKGWTRLPERVEKIEDAVEASYKVYTALLTQTGTNNPVATVLENTLTGTISFERYSQGNYAILNSTGWDLSKTTFLISSSGFARIGGSLIPGYIPLVGGGVPIATFGNTNAIPPNILPESDGQLVNSLIEIRIYN